MDMPGLDLRGGSGSIADCAVSVKSPSRVPANGLSGLVPLALATTGLNSAGSHRLHQKNWLAD
jgi:hypothetical protein